MREVPLSINSCEKTNKIRRIAIVEVHDTHHFQQTTQKMIFQIVDDTYDDAPRQGSTPVSDMEPLCSTS